MTQATHDVAVTGVDVTIDGPVLRIVLNNPKAGNALTKEAVSAFRDALAVAATSDQVRVVAVSSVGKNFCTGIDLVAANAPRSSDGAAKVKPRVGHVRRNMNQGAHALVLALAELELPMVVGVRGWAAGFGNTLALLGDYIVVSESAKFWTPFVKRGFTPDSGSTWLLPRLIGLPRAKEMILLGRPVEAAKAADWGMINEVVDDDALEARFEEVVQEFATAATVSVGLARAMIHRHLDSDLSEALGEETLAVEVSVRSDDFKEGIAAMMSRRDPDFTGR